MQKEFMDRYKQIEKSKKLSFLKELLLKNSELQEQFIEYCTEENISLDSITAVNIDEVRDEIWSEISAIDVDEMMENNCYHDYYEEDGAGDELLEAIFDPYLSEAISFLDKGNYLDAFRLILAIYELILIETPDVKDDNYFVFGDDIESYIDSFVTASLFTFSSKLEQKVVSSEMVNSLITLFFERSLIYKGISDENEENYNISHFELFFESIISKTENARNLLENIKKYKLDYADDIKLLCADVLDDTELYLKVANNAFTYNKEVALKLQKKYKELNK